MLKSRSGRSTVGWSPETYQGWWIIQRDLSTSDSSGIPEPITSFDRRLAQAVLLVRFGGLAILAASAWTIGATAVQVVRMVLTSWVPLLAASAVAVRGLRRPSGYRRSDAELEAVFDLVAVVALIVLSPEINGYNPIPLVLVIGVIGAAVRLRERLALWGSAVAGLTVAVTRLAEWPIDPSPGPPTFGEVVPVALTVPALAWVLAIGLREREAMIARLTRTNDELDRVNRELERFASTVAHDLRSPLTSIKGMAELLDRPDVPEGKRRVLRARICASVERLDDMMIGLLEHARAASEPLEVTDVDLAGVVEAIRLDHEALFEAHGATLDVAEDLPTIAASPHPFALVMGNLVTNAIQHAPDGRAPHVRVTAERVPGGVDIVVEDNGVGVPEASREHIFVPGHRLRESHTGYGLGLASCRAVVERHGGWIRAEDSPLGGLAVRFHLPNGHR